MSERTTSPWIYIGLGCLLAVVLAVGSCLALGWFGMQKAREMGEEMTDPVQRKQKVLATLGAEELPPGYHPVMAFSMPLGVMEMVMLGDEPPKTDEEGRSVPSELGDRGFIYVSHRTFGDEKEKLRAYLKGESRDPGPLDNLDIDAGLDYTEVLRRGRIEVGEVGYLYAAQRGDLRGTPAQRGALGGAGASAEGLGTTFMVECPGDDSRLRVGLWFAPVPESAGFPEGETEEVELDSEALKGTPVDEEALRELVGYFDLCR